MSGIMCSVIDFVSQPSGSLVELLAHVRDSFVAILSSSYIQWSHSVQCSRLPIIKPIQAYQLVFFHILDCISCCNMPFP